MYLYIYTYITYMYFTYIYNIVLIVAVLLVLMAAWITLVIKTKIESLGSSTC